MSWFSTIGIKKLFKYKMTHKETQLFNIIDGLLKRKETNVLVCPITSRYFIMNDKFGYSVIIAYGYYRLTNHKFFYNVFIEDAFSNLLIDNIKNHIKIDRDNIEQEMFKNETKLFNDIQTQLKEL